MIIDNIKLKDVALRIRDHNRIHSKERGAVIITECLNFAAEIIEKLDRGEIQPAPQWISVEERLPNHYEEVLVVSKLKNIVYFAWYDADISMFMGNGHMWTTREVTHWMPLPEPPKE